MGTPVTTPTLPADLDLGAGSDSEVRVVVVDGRHDRRQLLTYILQQAENVAVVGSADGPLSAVEAVGRLGANAAVLDVQLPALQGLDTISVLRDGYPSLAIIACSFDAGAATAKAALERGADAHLAKPFSVRDLRDALRAAMGRTGSDRGREPG